MANYRSILEYVVRSREQYGLIECTAKNAVGMQRESCRYLIVPAAGPYFPYSCLVANQSDSTLSIRCDGSLLANNTLGQTEEGQTDAIQPTDEDEDEDDEEFESGGNVPSRLKYHYHKRPEASGGDSSSVVSSNLSTSDIYAIYFAPDGDDPESGGDGSGQSATRLTYRNGGHLSPQDKANGGTLQLKTTASLLLNELVQRFNSHPLSQQPHLFVYPPTNYICEIYAMLPKPTLIKVSIVIACGSKGLINHS